MFRESQRSQIDVMQVVELMREGFQRANARLTELEEKSALVEAVTEIKQERAAEKEIMSNMAAAIEEMKKELYQLKEALDLANAQIAEQKEKHDKLKEHYQETLTWLKQLGEGNQ